MAQVFGRPFLNHPTHPLSGSTVLQLLPRLDKSPSGRSAIMVAAALQSAEARAFIACDGGRMTGDLQSQGGIFLPFPGRAKNPLVLAGNIRRLTDILLEQSIDVVHVRSRALAWIALAATRRTKTPLITTFKTGALKQYVFSRRYDSSLARGDIVLADSAAGAGLAAMLHPPAREKIRIIPFGVDCAVFAPGRIASSRVQDVRRHWNIMPSEQIILIVGSANSPTIREMTRLILATSPTGIKIVVASPREKGAKSECWNKQGGAAIALPPPPDWPAALLAASLVVAPENDGEGTSNILVEAQAIGTPVVAANSGAAAEIVRAPPLFTADERTGYLANPKDPTALALAVLQAMSLGASARGRLALRARSHVAARFSSERACAAILDAYAEARTLRPK